MSDGAAHARGLVDRVRASRTPTRLRALLYAAWAATAALFLVGEGAIGSARRALTVVGKDSAPSIIAAQEISSALADLDASAGNLLLGNAAHQIAASEVFEKRRIELTHSLVSAAQNITFGDVERAPLVTIFDGLGRYLELAAEARVQRSIELSPASVGRRDGAVRVYEGASDLMHEKLLPAADALDEANRKHLDHAYRTHRSVSGFALAGSIASGLLLASILVAGQIFLARRTRRIFNVPLAAATIVTLAMTGYLAVRIEGARAELKLATEDAFDSIHLSWKARAIAYDANGDETRYLLGGDRAAGFERTYREKMDRLLGAPRIDRRAVEAGPLPKSVTGLLADATRNVTFPGERAAVEKTILAFVTYDRIDEQIRLLERGGRHDRAVELCIGAGSDQSNAAFDRFDQALRKVIEINHAEMTAAITRGQKSLEIAAAISPIAALLIAWLTMRGVRQRLVEYAA